MILMHCRPIEFIVCLSKNERVASMRAARNAAECARKKLVASALAWPTAVAKEAAHSSAIFNKMRGEKVLCEINLLRQEIYNIVIRASLQILLMK